MAGQPQERAPARTEGEGATIGEAKWAAIKALERRFPGVAADDVRFDVLDEGAEAEGRPARVSAELDLERWQGVLEDLPDEPPERVRALVTRVALAFELRSSVAIDALQHIAARAAYRGFGDRKNVVIDAAGYRERREATLRRAADRAVEDALAFGRPVELEPMGPFERRTVHMYLRDRTDVQTHSEGDEPERRLVVSPVRTD